MKNAFISTVVLLCSVHYSLAQKAQKVPSLTYDASGEQIISAFHLDDGGGQCATPEKPVIAKIVNAVVQEDGIDLKLVVSHAANFGKVFGNDPIRFLGYWNWFPEHIKENLKTYLLRKGNSVRVWVAQCEGAGAIVHIAEFSRQSKPITVTAVEESISSVSTQEAISRARELERQIENKVKQIKVDFDREIAPNISKGEKEEFETTAEYLARLSALSNLRQKHRSLYWKRVYSETNDLVNEYLKLVASFYASPVRRRF